MVMMLDTSLGIISVISPALWVLSTWIEFSHAHVKFNKLQSIMVFFVTNFPHIPGKQVTVLPLIHLNYKAFILSHTYSLNVALDFYVYVKVIITSRVTVWKQLPLSIVLCVYYNFVYLDISQVHSSSPTQNENSVCVMLEDTVCAWMSLTWRW